MPPTSVIPRGVAADVNFQRVLPVGLAGEIAGQDHAGPEIDRPAVELGEEPRRDLEILDELGIGGSVSAGTASVSSRRTRAAGSRVELDVDDGAVEIAGRIRDSSGRDSCAAGPGRRNAPA